MQQKKPPIDARAVDRSTILILVLMAGALLVTLAVYFPGLAGPLLVDDIPNLKRLIDHSGDAPASLIENHLISNSGPFGRPVAMATFIGDAILHGSDIWWWKFSNVMYHLVGGLLVFWLTAALIRATGEAKGNRSLLTAMIVAAFWLLHPLHVSTVLYTVQRMTELSTVFTLAGLICYVQGRQLQENSPVKGWLTIAAGFGLFFPLALFSKENAVLFPAFCTLIEVLVFRFKGKARIQNRVKAFHGALVLGYLSVVVYVLANSSRFILNAYALRDFTFLERLLTEPRIIVLYIAQLLRPIQSKMGFFHDDIELSTSLVDPITTLFSIVFLAALAGSAIFLRKRLPLYAFGILFFFLAHALESSVFALELMFEHRNYLASFGILIALMSVIQAAIKGNRGKLLIVIIGLSGLSLLTWQRTITWASPATLYDFMYYAHPKSPRLSFIIADLHSEAADYDVAREALANIKPGLATGIYYLYIDCLEFRELREGATASVIKLPGGHIDSNVIANTRILSEAVLDGRCAVPGQALVPLVDHLLTLPNRSSIDERALLNIKTRLTETAVR